MEIVALILAIVALLWQASVIGDINRAHRAISYRLGKLERRKP